MAYNVCTKKLDKQTDSDGMALRGRGRYGSENLFSRAFKKVKIFKKSCQILKGERFVCISKQQTILRA
jgi:hypothetical protein